MGFLKLNNTTYKNIAKNNPKDLVEIIYGDDKDLTKFQPQQKVQRWDNECNVSIRLIEDKDELKETATIIEENGKIKHIKSKRECHFYNLGVSAEHIEGASEFEVILKKDPRKKKGEDYTIEFSLEDKDVDYFYQPALTSKEIAEGANRPENVVGSYAVYAKTPKINWTGGKEYKCGKIGHIFRPKIIDSAGTAVWGDLHIENGILSVTIPQDFLDKAVYPVRHAAGLTIGYTTIGGTGYGGYANYYIGSSKTTTDASGGNLSKIQIACKNSSAGTHVRMAVYTDSSGPSALVANSDSGSIGVTRTTKPTQDSEWTSSSAPTGAVSANTAYWVAANNDAAGITYYGDALAGGSQEKSAQTYANFPPATAPTGRTTNSYKISIYATYTAGGGGTVQPNHLMHLMGCGN